MPALPESVVSVPVSRLLLPRGRTFSTKPRDEKRFTASCQDGILIPVLLNGNYCVIDGLRRCHAASVLRHPEIPAWVLPQILSDHEQLRLRILLNPDRPPSPATLKRTTDAVRPLPTDWNCARTLIARAARILKTRTIGAESVLELTGGGRTAKSQAGMIQQVADVIRDLDTLLRHYAEPPPELTNVRKSLVLAAKKLLNFRQG